ncbi:MAG: tannase/feruloyl esterase family alpha/beta hydrolase, partial [bacterium]|nr:tannase/feruloyl esterase family alpha/beta hydrolase [bacterium]
MIKQVHGVRWSLVLLALCVALSSGAYAMQTPTPDNCEALVHSGTGHTTIVSAVWVDEAALVPAHCLVEGFVETGNPAVGLNHVNFRAWLPLPWNGKFHMQGGGGFAGVLPDTSDALLRNYADIGTDTGHQAGVIDASWAQDNPTAVIDFGYR